MKCKLLNIAWQSLHTLAYCFLLKSHILSKYFPHPLLWELNCWLYLEVHQVGFCTSALVHFVLIFQDSTKGVISSIEYFLTSHLEVISVTYTNMYHSICSTSLYLFTPQLKYEAIRGRKWLWFVFLTYNNYLINVCGLNEPRHCVNKPSNIRNNIKRNGERISCPLNCVWAIHSSKLLLFVVSREAPKSHSYILRIFPHITIKAWEWMHSSSLYIFFEQ